MELEGIAEARALFTAMEDENTDVLKILLAEDADVNIIWTMIRIRARLGRETLDYSNVLFTDLEHSFAQIKQANRRESVRRIL